MRISDWSSDVCSSDLHGLAAALLPEYFSVLRTFVVNRIRSRLFRYLRHGGLLALGLAVACFTARAERIKDIASIQGVRANQLVGYGLVVGLDRSGDQVRQAPFTQQSLTNMLSQLGAIG